MDLIALRPSGWIKLEAELADPAVRDAFEGGLRDYFRYATLDGGMDTDRLYVTSVKTYNAGAWSQLGEDRMAEILMSAERDVAGVFVSGLPKALQSRLRDRLGL